MIINQVVSGGGGSSVAEPYIEYVVDASGNFGFDKNTSHLVDLSDVVNMKAPLGGVYASNTNISGFVDLGKLKYISVARAFASMFSGATGITGFDMSKLETIGDQVSSAYENACADMFAGCTRIVGRVDLHSLRVVSCSGACSRMFQNCTGITSVDVSGLEELKNQFSCLGNFVEGCTGLTEFKFESLKVLSVTNALYQCFYRCTNLQDVWFYALNTNSFGTTTGMQFNSMLSGVTGCTVHFPMAIQNTIGSWGTVTGGFGGTNTTVLFDLVTSLTGADGNTYTRSEKNSTATATAWTYNDTLYYTSGVSNHTAGVNEAQVGDTIYSDSACITAVTTISSIA